MSSVSPAMDHTTGSGWAQPPFLTTGSSETWLTTHVFPPRGYSNLQLVKSFPDTGGYYGFGYSTGSSYHNGADYYAPVGTVVSAVANGEVVISGEYNGFGSINPSTKGGVIVVKHIDKNGNHFFAVYGHINRFVAVGTKITKGQTLGTIDASYNSGVFVPHLHFGIYTGWSFPNSGWGYSSSLTGWHEPKTFLETNL